ncbi:hypothetical protein HT031_003306 [Scenedesmus sp. PABB004]|nr:hypothetical protein HT031_003306 [Scenedesmus sp. PABB004]
MASLARAPGAPRLAASAAPARPALRRALALAPRASSDKPSPDKHNIYHDRETTKSRRSNPAGSKDGNVRRAEKEQQYEYQQERLEWRRKNQIEGTDVEREELPHNNMSKVEGDYSAERRGPEVEGSGHGHGDTLKELVDNVKGALKGKKQGRAAGGDLDE